MAKQNKKTRKSTSQRVTRKKTATRQSRTISERIYETDSTYFLKLVIVAICGTLWLKFQEPLEWMSVTFNALPIGLLIGVIFVKNFEKYQSDRKIWYAVLLIVTILSLFAPVGIFV